MPDKCYICSIQCVLKEKFESQTSKFGIPCDRCRRTVCRTCTNIATSEVRAIELSNRSASVRYYCPGCADEIMQLDSLRGQIQSLTLEVEEIKKRSFQARPSYADALKKVEIIANEVNEAKVAREISEKVLQETAKQLSTLEDRVKILGDQDQTNVTEDARDQAPVVLAVESAVDEFKEREVRRRNIMIVGIQEIPSGPRQERIAAELAKAKDIVSSVDPTVPLDSVTCHRIGRYSEAKSRPILMTFSNAEDPLKLLKQRAKLTGNVYIKADQTKLQKEYMAELVKQLETRRTAGELDLIIRYIKGTPKIVKNFRKQSKN